MKKIRIFDTESDGFVDQATRLWCISEISYEATEDEPSLFPPDNIDAGLDRLWDCDVLVCHNVIEHDLPLLKKLYGWEPRRDQIVIDTLVFSRLLYPKRPRPKGYLGKGMHSIEAWGYRLGLAKPEHEDWTRYSEDMGVRCQKDVLINRLVLKELENEAGATKYFYH